MKDCTHCKYAEWERTKNGALHPKGDGRCTYTVKIPPLPASQYWAWEAQGHPKVLGGWINRRLHLLAHCVYYEAVPR